MAKINIIDQFRIGVNKNVVTDSKLNQKIKDSYNEFEKLLTDKGFTLKKLSDFKYRSFNSKTKTIDLELAVVKYFPSLTFKHTSFLESILEIFQQLPIKYKIKKNQNYIAIHETYKDQAINYRFILLIRKKKNDLLIDYVNRNGIVQDDRALQLTEAFAKANKISGNTLSSVKRLINYILKDQFKYTYNLDYFILTWFYEFIAKSMNQYLDTKFNNLDKSFDYKKLNEVKYLSKWFKQKININNLYYFIFSKFNNYNSYFFSELQSESIEIFADISRYSLNTNSNFIQRSSFFAQMRIFDLQNFDDLSYIQSHCGNEYGYSKIAWDKARNEGKRYFASPKIITGNSNFAIFQRLFTSISTDLYSKLSQELKEEIKSMRQREAMEDLNLVAHNWLSSYEEKIKYLKPYFDHKYPLSTQSDWNTIIRMITTMVDKVNENDWIIENDN
ncbi:hypothetical protein [Spiroplasma culicicola]|uniref:Uncharacterized protein n=1 Tax=Spiroplasma culicicola AES-1 TaxID=1276246 RepID=W6AGF2_9MOLU|nr:hypothetical protein [Spiroplasma culicicola]AHI52749.1 hypothetical protein SCULI_v1c04080 [Spiroplasma culicicola AES-1]